MKNTIEFNSARAGFGKTQFIINKMEENLASKPISIQIFVTTSIDNASEKYKIFNEKFGNVYYFSSENTDGSVANSIVDTINHAVANKQTNTIICMTYQAYTIAKQRNVLNSDTLLFDLFLDEVPDILQTIPLNVGNMTSQNIIANLTDITYTQNFNKVTSTNDTVFNNILKIKDTMTVSLKNFANSLTNTSYYKTFCGKGQLTKFNDKKKFYNNEIIFYSLTNPEMFEGARNTLITAARFKETVFYSAYKSYFDFVDVSPENSIEHDNGHRLTINYFSDMDITRYINDMEDVLTGEKNIDVFVENIDSICKENNILYTNRYRIKGQNKLINPQKTFLSTMNVVGLNNLTCYNNSVFAATNNPSYEDINFYEEVLNIGKDQLIKTRLYTMYQCMFRDSMRDVSSEENVNWYVLDANKAFYLQNCFNENNKPKIQHVTNNFFFNKKSIKKETKEIALSVIRNSLRKVKKPFIASLSETSFKFDSSGEMIQYMVNNQQRYHVNGKNDVNFLLFEFDKTHAKNVENILTRKELNNLLYVSQLGSNVKLLLPLSKTINADMYKDVCDYFVKDVLDNTDVKVIPYNAAFHTNTLNSVDLITSVSGNDYDVKELFSLKEFKNFVVFSLHDDKNISVTSVSSVINFTNYSAVGLKKCLVSIKNLFNISTKEKVINEINVSRLKKFQIAQILLNS